MLIPRSILFSDPEKYLVKISPNGKFLSFLAPFQDNLTVWWAPCEHPEQAQPVVSNEQHPIKEYQWARSSEYLLYFFDQGGDENWQLASVEMKSGKTQIHTERGVQARIFGQSPSQPGKVLIGLNQRDKRFHDVYCLDLHSGEHSLVYENNRYWDFFANAQLEPAIAITVGSEGLTYWDLEKNKGIAQARLHDAFGQYFYPRMRLGLSENNQTLYLVQGLETNTSSVAVVDRNTGVAKLLGNDPLADICDVLLDPLTQAPLAYAINYDRKKWVGLTPEIQADLDYLSGLDAGDIEIASQTADNRQWTVNFLHDTGPIRYYLFNRLHRDQTRFLFDSHSAFKRYTFSPMKAVKITARDGLECLAYLSLPQAFSSAKPVPLVLMVHGGPNYRDVWGFNSVHQWLTNRGYAVLSVNYRGSIGYGEAHFKAGNGEWAGKIQTDLLDAVEWAIAQKITTRDKVAIMGRSFGGYATLVGLTMTPDHFCCGVDIVGPANLETMAKHFPPYWQAMRSAIHGMIGCDPDTEDGKAYLRERSPYYYAKNIKKPLLIGHGANDVRVLQSESDHLVETMQANKIPVTYAIFPDEGHQFLHPGNRMAFYALAERFLAESLGGKYEPIDPSSHSAHSSMVIKVDDFCLLETERSV